MLLDPLADVVFGTAETSQYKDRHCFGVGSTVDRFPSEYAARLEELLDNPDG